MSEEIKNQITNNFDEISFKELTQKIYGWFSFLKTQWWKIAIVGFIGGAIGFVYAWMQPIPTLLN
jgi:hypothetical protein